MSAKLAEKLSEIGEAMAALGELFTEASALYDAASAKSSKSGDDGAAGKVSGRSGKAGVGSKGNTAGADDPDDLPEPTRAAGKKTSSKSKKPKEVTEDDVRDMAKQLMDKMGNKKGKAKVVEILGGKLADVDEEEYSEKYDELKAALDEADEPGAEDDV